MSKKKVFLITIVSFLISISVGYALFSQSVNISGTSTAQGTFDVEFLSATISDHDGSTNETVEINNDHDQLELTVPELAYPGAYSTITVVVKNVGTIPAKLTGITTNGLNTDPNILITSNVDTVQNVVMAQNQTTTFTITVTWIPTSQEKSENVEFTIGLNYSQATS